MDWKIILINNPDIFITVLSFNCSVYKLQLESFSPPPGEIY